jgi:hypothetical protein
VPDRALRRAAWEREGGRCIVTGAPLGDPDGDTWNLHHRRPGGMGGTSRPDQDTLPNVIAVADNVHRGIHENPQWSEPVGLLLPTSEQDPASVPVRSYRGWVFLLPEGGYRPVE